MLMTDNSERKVLRRYLFKIGSAAEKVPNGFNIRGNFLDCFDGVYGHEFLFFFATDCTENTDGISNSIFHNKIKDA
jgi:hypothetical protein